MAVQTCPPSSSSSSSYSLSNYDVFLSFRGDDTRSTFTSHLKTALEREGIRTFMDKDDLKKGEEIEPTLVKAIEQSRISIPIFSTNYASSRWCLDELVKILECREKFCRTVLPIFFDVNPSDVRSQKGSFFGAFRSHEERFEYVKVLRWRDALREAGYLAGWNVKDYSHESMVVESVVKAVRGELNDMPLDVGTCTVGIDSRVEDFIIGYLDAEFNDAQFVGIHGMGGIGKTIITKAIYNKIFRKFEGSSFLGNVREGSQQQNGLVGLQQKLLFNILKQEYQHISHHSQGINVIKQRFVAMKVLVVLDDVDKIEQLNALAGSPDWFGPGSRIVITTRDMDILKVVDKNMKIYNVEPLNDSQSLQLFSMHAFKENHPPEDYMEDSKKVVSIARGLPSILEVLGFRLLGKRRIEWKDTLKELKKIPLYRVHEKLKISYDALDPQEKEIFLDIAFFFIGKEKENALHIWEGCGFCPKIALEVLVNKTLVKINDNKIGMHDQLRKMGREIVLQENSMVARMRSRLCSHEEVDDALKNQKGPSNVEGLIFKSETPLDVKAFESLCKLRLLRVDYVQLYGNFEHLPLNLRWISWIGCPLRCIGTDFHPKKLVVLDLSWSKVTQVWNSWPQNKFVEKLEMLKVVDLSHCNDLTRTPDFVGLPNLERMFLEGCGALVEVHESIGCLKRLVFLNLKYCGKLEELPSSICMLKSLTELLVDGCTSLTELPISIGSLKKLEILSARWCSSLTVLPDSIGNLESLLDLNLGSTPILKLPESIGSLSKLRRLSLRGCRPLRRIPNSVGGIESLVELFLNETQITEIPDFHASLSKLEKLEIRRCKSFSKLPDSINNLRNLTALDIYGSIVTELPDAIGSLEKLEMLNLDYCENLVGLPDSTVNLRNLRYIYMCNTAIDKLPKDFGKLLSLVGLQMAYCDKLKGFPENFGDLAQLKILNANGCKLPEGAIPSDFGKLSSLEILDLDMNNFCNLPTSISDLSLLNRLSLKFCSELRSLPVLPSSLRLLDAKMCTSLKSLPDLSNLASLQELNLWGCNNLAKVPGFERLESLTILNLSWCNWLVNSNVPASTSGFYLLKRLHLNGTELQSLSELPSSLIELDATYCKKLEKLPDLSNLKDLSILRLSNCKKLAEIPGLEKLESLKILDLVGCSSLAITVKQILVKGKFKHLPSICFPGSEILDGFSPCDKRFEVHRDLVHEVKEVHLCIVFELKKIQRSPIIRDIQFVIWRNNTEIYRTELEISGTPNPKEGHIYFCRLYGDNPSLRSLAEGGVIQVEIQAAPITTGLNKGIQLKKAGIRLVYGRPIDDASEYRDRTTSEKDSEYFSFSMWLGSEERPNDDDQTISTEHSYTGTFSMVEKHKSSWNENEGGPSIAAVSINGHDFEESRSLKRLKHVELSLSLCEGGSVGAIAAETSPSMRVRKEMATWAEDLVLGASSSEMPAANTFRQTTTVEETEPMEHVNTPIDFFTFL